jgi:demethylmenaquinone methyltransferase / 2-methoxy-6-polyprenyl-1,4-benzoquinol methylase
MFDRIAPRYDLVNRLMTFRLDVLWRRRTVRALGLGPGAVVVDVACGTGDLCNELSRVGCRSVGLDYSLGMLRARRTTSPVALADAQAMPVAAGGVDGATCGFALRNFVDLDAVFAELARVLRHSGRIALLDAAQPEGRVTGFGHRIWFGRIVPRIGGLLSDGEAYRYLPRSLGYLPPPGQLLTMLGRAGFTDMQRSTLLFGAAQLITATRA